MTEHPIVWWELASHNAEKTVRFFREVFGWEINLDQSSGFYKLQHNPPTIGGGNIFTLRRAKLPFLTLYIRVSDIHAMAGKVEKHGGFIVDPPAELAPGTWLCLFNEPSGVMFGMLEEKA